MIEFEYIVVGNGLFGSAATHYLSGFTKNVAVIGPDEPRDQTTHDGVFASHYDQRRLTRLIGRTRLWVDISRIAIENYRNLEAQSGILFYDPVGVLVARADHIADNYVESPLETARRANIVHTYYRPGDRSWQDRFPEYNFPDTHSVLYEPAPAGMIDPRAMLHAQLKIARAQGAVVIPQIVTRVDEENNCMRVTTQDGAEYRASKVLITAGAFSNFHDLLPRKLALEPKSEVVMLAEVTEAAARELGSIPAIGYSIDHPLISDLYLTPPVRYENGRYYAKMGANTVADEHPITLGQLQTWFRSGPSDVCHAALEEAIRAMLPSVDFLSFVTKRCVITRTPSKYPMIDRLSERLFIAAGGNGAGAKSADGWGRLAAGLMHDERWLEGVPRDPLRAVYL